MSEFSTSPGPISLVGSIVGERYQVEDLLGAGAMGQVYRARHVHMQKQVALKVLHRETGATPEIVSRFEREAIAAGRISHPNVAAATDFGRLPSGAFYLVLEFVSGQSLRALIDEVGALPIERTLGLATQIFSALSAAHRAEIVHRDLKPDNIMLLKASTASVPGSSPGLQQDLVKVLDFGLAKLQSSDPADTQLTQAGAIYGTPQYMAPEQASGAEVDHRADLYAAGVVMYEMLTGEPPFQADQVMPLLLMHMTETPPPLPASIPKNLESIVLRLLEKSPEQRYQTADAVLAALNDLSGAAAQTAPLFRERTLESSGVKTLSAWVQEHGRTVVRALTRTIEIRGIRVPLGLPLATLGVALLSIAIIKSSPPRSQDSKVTARAEEQAPPAAPEKPAPKAPAPKSLDPELMKVIDAAKLGSDPALYALEHRDDADRSDAEWMALTQAYLMRRDIEKALPALGHALESNPRHATDMTILGALRYLADDERAAEPILAFVAEHLPDVAADFLFDVWSKTSAKTKATETAKRLLDSPSVREHQSEALELALSLRGKTECGAQVELLPRIILRADERALPRLRDMRKDTACAKLAGAGLDEAITQAALRKAPRFPLLRRWRWKTGEVTAPGETTGGEPKSEKKKKFILF